MLNNLLLTWQKCKQLLQRFRYKIFKLYVTVVTLSIKNDIIFLENIKQGFKRTISCNQYISEITTQTKNFNLDYLNDPAFRIINRFFLLPFKNDNDDPTKILQFSITCH